MKKLNRHLLRQALDAVAAPALIIDAQHRDRQVVYANAALGAAIGLHPNEIIGRPADSLADSAFDPASPEPWRPRSSRGAVELRPAPLYDQPGRASYWLLTAAPSAPAAALRPIGPSGTAPSMAGTGVFMATDVWARGLRDERTDATTGIPGRNALLEVLMRDWAVARREQQRLSVIVFRVDALESYHTLFGRHATEALLRKVAHSIANSLQRAADYCARVGHDRFAVLIGGAEEERVVAFAERIAQRVRDLALHHPRSQLARYVTVSWTVASEIPATSAEEPALLEDAEARISGAALQPSNQRDDELNVDAG
ncbi:MAG: diguanylate cyclase [Chromatiales bacterium]|nr:diguanylate cyclase [Chromatiales bacterium]